MLSPYEKIDFIDHVQDIETGEVLLQGTPLCRRTLGRMDDGIAELYAEFDALYTKMSLLARQIGYTNPDMAGVDNVEQALDALSSTKAKIVLMPEGEEIPVSQREENTYYLKVTDSQSGGVSGAVYISPGMAAQIID